MKLQKHLVRNIISVERIPYEEGMCQHFLEVRLLVECHGTLKEQLWCFGKDDWFSIKKDGFFLA